MEDVAGLGVHGCLQAALLRDGADTPGGSAMALGNKYARSAIGPITKSKPAR